MNVVRGPHGTDDLEGVALNIAGTKAHSYVEREPRLVGQYD